MEHTLQVNTGMGRSRFSKVLPMPPSNDIVPKGRVNPFPSAYRALPPIPKSDASSVKTIPRRPVGVQTSSKEPSITSVSQTYSESPKMLPEYQSIARESMEAMEARRTPLPPPKDMGNRPLRVIPQEPSHLQKASTSSTTSTNTLSPPPEIWKRRTEKNDRGVNILGLKLTKSNGSTASPIPVDASSSLPVSNNSLPPFPTQNAQPTRGLPGRSIKPVRPAPPQPDVMGSKISKLLDPERKGLLSQTDKGRTEERPSDYQPTPIKRLPTPEYQPSDKPFQQPPAPQVLLPTSPDTPPSDLSPGLGDLLDEYIASLDPPKTPNDLKLHPSLRPSEPVEVINQQSSPKSSQQQPQPNLPNVLTIKRPPSRPPAAAASSPVTAVQKPLEIFPSAALSTVQFDCYQSHRQMKISRNDLCPLACMVCEVKDTGNRWKCAWCDLRCCQSCMRTLVSVPEMDLRKCLERIGRGDRIVERAKVSTVRYSGAVA